MVVVQRLAAAVASLVLASGVGLSAGDDIRGQQWHLDFLHLDRAHEISTGKGVIVGVVDTGVDGGHPDLAGQLLRGADFSVEHLSDGLTDRDGHGTAMAGLIVANGRAIGVAPGAKVLPVRHSTYSSTALGADEAVDWAVDHGVTVLCLALSYPDPDSRLRAAIERAIARDVVVVAAVGNVPDKPGYPALYPGVVGGVGTDRNGEHARISIVSPAAVLAAPAVDIMTTRSRSVVPSGYGTGTGTSDATAIIAGVAALVRSKFPDLSAEEVIHRMTATADDRGAPGRDDEYGYGIVDPVAALTADVPPLHPPTTPVASPTDASGGGDGSSTPLVVGAGAAIVGVAILIVVGLVLALRRR
jgi:type VII secretion-associated serine protease mycosin